MTRGPDIPAADSYAEPRTEFKNDVATNLITVMHGPISACLCVPPGAVIIEEGLGPEIRIAAQDVGPSSLEPDADLAVSENKPRQQN
jgi:hypothetical protein